MSTVQSEITCPQCGYEECFRDFNCRTYTEYESCSRCWYLYETRVKIDRIRSKATGEKWYLRAKNGGLIYYSVERLGFGFAKVQYFTGEAIWPQFRKPINSRDIRRFTKLLEDPRVDASMSYLVRFDSERIGLLT